ncbi:EF-P 5-aminopentanol modification-associated protein YfmF [Mangrovibacillus cuniculi]|uniref:Insulinase family protein n=1 Tax=Mangrovibacillus cuniculi TaxID=2593652 RepID=A0A7S8CAI5_9BACI|nr:pitrilysin family protein [Mangrovibacillus cuniculi]QPC46405.1 insulinase family protein [Mangrovibacillus cuniculi]
MYTENKTQLNGLNLHTVKSEKFKTNTIVLKSRAPLTKETVTKRAILPYILQSSTKKYPTTTSFRSYLDELYGASFYVDVAKKGEEHVLTFSIEVANEKYLKDSTPLLDKALEFLAEVIFQPNADDGSFTSDVISQEKKNAKQRIQAVYDDKMRYGNARLVEEMCKGEAYALHVHGEKEDVDQLTESSMYEYYQTFLQTDHVDLYVVGDLDEEAVKQSVEKLFPYQKREAYRFETEYQKNVSDVHVVKEPQPVKQGKLNIGFRTNISYKDKEYYALQVYNGILGGFSHSKLFINVREKASLAYYAASRVESHKGLLMVMSGIEFSKYDQAVDIIQKQVDAMKTGDFTDKDLSQTKAVMKNQLLETLDTARGLVEVYYQIEVAAIDASVDDWFTSVEAVTKKEIEEVAQKIQLDTIYFLTGEEETA